MLAWSERSAARLLELDGDDDRISGLAERRDALLAALAGYAGAVSRARRAAADAFAAAVTVELAELAMPHARIEVRVAQREVEAPAGLPLDGEPAGAHGARTGSDDDDADGVGSDAAADEADPETAAGTARSSAARAVRGPRRVAFGPNGVDDVEIRLAPHPGAPFLPIGKGASGGELSRVMLAVEVVFAGADPVPTFVFDEVDAGVGGRAAVEVGRRLARLARSAQVIVVTHLPQVAAFADRQLLVRKESDGSITSSGVTVLDDAERRAELARMLSGLDQSELGRAHADELLAAARAERAAA